MFLILQIVPGPNSIHFSRVNAGPVGSIYVTPHGSFLGSTMSGDRVLLWQENRLDLVNLNGIRTASVKTQREVVVGGSLDEACSRAFTLDLYDKLRLYRFEGDKATVKLPKLTDPIVCSRQGFTAYAGRGLEPNNSVVILIDDRTGKPIRRIPVPGQVSAVTILPRHRLDVGNHGGTVQIYTFRGLLIRQDKLPASFGGPVCIEASGDERSALIATAKGYAVVQPTAKGPLRSFALSQPRPVGIGDIRNKDVIVGFSDGRVDRYSRTGKLRGTWMHRDRLESLVVRGGRIIAGTAPGK